FRASGKTGAKTAAGCDAGGPDASRVWLRWRGTAAIEAGQCQAFAGNRVSQANCHFAGGGGRRSSTSGTQGEGACRIRIALGIQPFVRHEFCASLGEKSEYPWRIDGDDRALWRRKRFHF